MKKSLLSFAVLSTLCSAYAFADEAAAPAAAAEASAPAAPVMNGPGWNYPLVPAATPLSFDMGGPVGKIYVSGALTALGMTSDGVAKYAPIGAVNKNSVGDISNAQLVLQKIDGPVQFFVQAGTYSTPVLGTGYLRASHTTSDYYGEIPTAYVKLVPNDTFSFQAGKLPTLLGVEYTFTYENTNIQRGLLWAQENVFTRGVQANYAKGPFTASVQYGDGFYTKDYKFLTASASYAINDSNTISVAAGGNVDKTKSADITNSFAATPQLANSQIYNLIYKYSKGPLTIQPYLQYTYVPSGDADMNYNNDGGATTASGAHTYAGAILANYAVNSEFNIGARVEYIKSTGAQNMLGYGAGSKAWSATITPTYQYKNAFVRGELSYVKVNDLTAGSGFGSLGKDDSQAVAMVETGFLF